MKKKVIYIAGKTRGLPDLGRARFASIQKQLEDAGYAVLNPTLLPTDMSERKYMPICLSMIEVSDCVYVLSNWSTSRGAHIEIDYAQYQNKQIVYENSLTVKKLFENRPTKDEAQT